MGHSEEHEKALHLIEVELLGKNGQSGDSRFQAIKEMDFVIDDGESVTVMGQSGFGKSTVLSILGSLNNPARGKVYIDTIDVYDLPSERRADQRSKYIGTIFQSFQLIPYLTVQENVKQPMATTGISAREQDRKANEVLQRAGLGARTGRMPDQLSGGEQKRGATARATVNSLPVPVAEGPAGSLDSKTARELMGLLQQLNKDGTTIIMVSHDQQNARYSDRTTRAESGYCKDH